MTNHKKLIDVIASLDRSCLFFHKRKGTLKIDQSEKCRHVGLVWELHAPTHWLLTVSWQAIPLAVSLRILGGIASHPLALLTLSILSSLSTAWKHISWKSKGSLTVSQDRVVSRIEKAEGATPLHDRHHRVSSSIKVRHNTHTILSYEAIWNWEILSLSSMKY